MKEIISKIQALYDEMVLKTQDLSRKLIQVKQKLDELDQNLARASEKETELNQRLNKVGEIENISKLRDDLGKKSQEISQQTETLTKNRQDFERFRTEEKMRLQNESYQISIQNQALDDRKKLMEQEVKKRVDIILARMKMESK